MIHEKKRFSIILIVLLLSGFFVTSWLSYQVAIHSIDDYVSTDTVPLTSDTIYSEIRHDLFKPIFISSLMAQDTFVRDWKLDGEKTPDDLVKYLSEIKNKYNTITSYFISEASKNYFHSSGILKKVSENDPLDSWYFSLKNTPVNQHYEIKIDQDTANPNNMTIFVNYKVYDYNNNFIGATGVGLSLQVVTKLIEDYEQRYKRTVYFTDINGNIDVYGNNFGNERTLQERFNFQQISDAVLNTHFYKGVYKNTGSKVFFNSRFIEELDWYLIVEHDVFASENKLTETFIINLFLSLLVTSGVVFIAHITFSKYQKKLIEMASIDKLSGLLNRQSFEPTLLKNIKASQRNTIPLSLILMDIDHFKKINDSYGHLVGDNVIQRVSSICKEESSDISAVCRWGGEEFIIMLPNSNISDAKSLALKIQNSIHSIDIKPDVTMSFGITQLKPDDELDRLLHRADDLLYQAKRNGRNRIEVSE